VEQLPPSPAIESAGDLLSALQDAGADPAASQGLLLESLGGSAAAWRVSGAEVQIYEYPSRSERSAVAGRISPDGLLDGRPQAWGPRPHVWAVGRLIVVYAGSDGGVVLLLSGLLGDPLTAPAASPGEPYPPAVLAAMQALAEELGRSPAEVLVLAYREVEWPDGCLGLPAEGESCTLALVPGWLVQLAVEGVGYELRTDQLGFQVRRQ
jgi:hypothetical protein